MLRSWIGRQELNRTEHALLDYLAERCNDDLSCAPNLGDVAQVLYVSRRTVERSLRSLIERGIVTRTLQLSTTRGNLPSILTLRANVAA